MSDSVGGCGSLFLPCNRNGGRKSLPHQDLLSFLPMMVNGVGWHWLSSTSRVGGVVRLRRTRRTLIWLDQSSPFFRDSFGSSSAPRPSARRGRGAIPRAWFSPSKALFSPALPPPQGRRARPRRNVTTVDQSDIRVLVNALNDPSGASSFYRAGVRATKARAQGCDEGSPDPYTRRGLVGRPSGPDHNFSGIPRHDAPLLHGSSRQ